MINTDYIKPQEAQKAQKVFPANSSFVVVKLLYYGEWRRRDAKNIKKNACHVVALAKTGHCESPGDEGWYKPIT